MARLRIAGNRTKGHAFPAYHLAISLGVVAKTGRINHAQWAENPVPGKTGADLHESVYDRHGS